MTSESKIDNPPEMAEAGDEMTDNTKVAEIESEAETDHDEPDAAEATAATGTTAPTSASKSKKKRSKAKKKLKSLLGGGGGDGGDNSSHAAGGASSSTTTGQDDASQQAMSGLSTAQAQQLLAMNPALAADLGVASGDVAGAAATEALRKMRIEDVMTGLAASGRNAKDMSSYKFWQTQPVPKFGGAAGEVVEEGPFKIVDPEKVPKTPSPLLDGFEWVTMDLMDEKQLKEVYELLSGHYVEDQEAILRFNYSASFFKWALFVPGWVKEWHVGVRATKSQKLVAFISGIPIQLRIRAKVLRASEINFLCIHKKLRSQRLAPVLIKEITRRCHVAGVWQAIYTAGVVLPKPISTCRYFHRALDWQKLYEIGFSPLPSGSKPSYQVRKYALPDQTSMRGLREMQPADMDQVLDLLTRYLAKFDAAPLFDKDELAYWLLHQKDKLEEQVIWSYVVEDPTTHKITDFFSFYDLESTVIGNAKHSNIRAAYLFYYALETALSPPTGQQQQQQQQPSSSLAPAQKAALKTRLNELVHDALVVAKRHRFDVFNTTTLMDNCLFLEQQKFGAGDGQLHYYLYNYNANAIAGGVDRKNRIDEENCSGIGVVML